MSETINSEIDEQQEPQVQDPQDGADGCVDVDADSNGASVEETLNAELVACRAEVEKQKDLYLRTRAETDNFRRRMQREKEELGKFANENILREVLPVLDNLQRAVSHARDLGAGDRSSSGDTSLLDGVEMTLSQFKTVFEKFHVTPIVALDTLFDPACHEAMGQLERADCPPNTVVDVLQEGYLLSGRLLRPALVMVSKAPSVVEDESK